MRFFETNPTATIQDLCDIFYDNYENRVIHITLSSLNHMAKANRDKQIQDKYSQYKVHLDTDKTINGELRVITIKPNHKNFYAGESDVKAHVPFGNTSMECKIKSTDEYQYTITYKSDAIDKRLLTRLDAGAGTHRNKAPGIPLELTSVPTPHYHEYRNDGYDIAYPIEGVNYSDESSTKFDYNQGVHYFCNKLHINNTSGEKATMTYTPEGVLPLNEDNTDPNENVEFP